MFRCNDYQELMVDAFYGEMPAGQRGNFEEHLKTCKDCKLIYQEMTQTLGVMSKRKRQDPGPEFWNNYWNRLEPKLTTPQQASKIIWWERAASHRKLFVQAAAAAFFILLGVIIGKFYLGNRVDAPPQITKKTVEAMPMVSTVNDRAYEFLERSEVLLLGVVNSGEGHVDLSRPKDLSRNLIKNASSLKQELNNPEQQKLKRLVTDLELILLQIASLEDQTDMPEIELIKDGVDRRAVLLKINLEKMRMGELQAKNANRPGADGGI